MVLVPTYRITYMARDIVRPPRREGNTITNNAYMRFMYQYIVRRLEKMERESGVGEYLQTFSCGGRRNSDNCRCECEKKDRDASTDRGEPLLNVLHINSRFLSHAQATLDNTM